MQINWKWIAIGLVAWVLIYSGLPEDGFRAVRQPRGDRLRYFHYLQAYRWYGFDYAIRKYGVEPKL